MVLTPRKGLCNKRLHGILLPNPVTTLYLLKERHWRRTEECESYEEFSDI